jgi:methyl-accepting chemotaxis protein
MKWMTGSVRNKIIAIFAAGLLVVFGSGLYGIGTGRSGLRQVESITGTAVEGGFAVAHMESRFKVQVQEWKNVLLRGGDPAALDKHWSGFVKEEAEVRESGQAALKLLASEKSRDLVARFLAAHEEMGKRYRIGVEAFKNAGHDASKGDAAVKGIDRAPAELLEQAVTLTRNDAKQQMAKAVKDMGLSFNIALALMATLALSTAALSAWAIVRTVVRPVRAAEELASAVASGNLTLKIEAQTHDEIGNLLESLNTMQQHLNRTVRTIKSVSDTVGTAAKEIAQGHTDLSSRTEEQASSLEETAASMEEMTATVTQNAENAKKASQLAASASEVAQKGGEAVRRVVRSMDGISDSSKKIADITGVIDGIAFQTNILALNAAVEAARAGEQGRGFAVVASEVRSLAQRSAAAAKEIKGLITDAASKVDSGTREVADAGKTIDEVVSSVKRVNGLIAEISAASQEQSQSISQVSDTVQQLEKVTQQNAAMVEEATAASASLEEQADSLTRAVGSFTLDATQARSAAPSAPVRRERPGGNSNAGALPVTAPKKVARLASKAPAEARTAEAVRTRATAGAATEKDWEEF